MTAQDDRYFKTAFQYTPVDQERNIASKRRVIEIMQAMTNEPLDRLDEAGAGGFRG